MSRRSSHLRLLPAPQADPPYDDEVGSRSPAELGTVRGAIQGTLALSFPALSEPAKPSAPHLRLVRPDEIRGQPAASSGPPPLAQWARSFVQALLEALCGRRSLQQLVRWTSAEVYEELRRRACRPLQVRHRPMLRSIRWSEPLDGVAEVSAVVQIGGRRHAFALRLEDRGGRWQCTALEMGPIRS